MSRGLFHGQWWCLLNRRSNVFPCPGIFQFFYLLYDIAHYSILPNNYSWNYLNHTNGFMKYWQHLPSWVNFFKFVISHQKKRRPQLETILATRPKGYHHAKWLEKTVASDSHLKTKLLRDVIISQVKKLLKRQAELRNRICEKNLDAGKITSTN